MSQYLNQVLSPALKILQDARDYLATVALGARRGIDLSHYLGPLAVLGPGFQAMLATLITGAVLILTIALAKGAYSLYLQFKQGVKWW